MVEFDLNYCDRHSPVTKSRTYEAYAIILTRGTQIKSFFSCLIRT